MRFWKTNRGEDSCAGDRSAGRLADVRSRGRAEGTLYAPAPVHEPERVERPAKLFWTPDDLAEAQG